MVLYTCPRCGYSNKIKTHMKKHFLRQTVCSPTSSNLSIGECFQEILGKDIADVSINVSTNVSNCKSNITLCKSNVSNCKSNVSIDVSNIYKCKYCSKNYLHRQSKYTHEKSCKYKDIYTNDKVSEKDAIIADKDKMIAAQEKQRENDRELIYELKTQVTKLIDKVGSVGNTTNIQNNTINIMLNAFGKEDISYIQDRFVKLLIKEGPYSCIPKLVRAIHFHPKHKENHNILIPNKKQALAKVYNGEEWEYKNKNDTIDDITDKAYGIIYNHYDDTKSKSKYMDKFMDNYEDHEKDTMKKVKGGTEIVILNNQDKINT